MIINLRPLYAVALLVLLVSDKLAGELLTGPAEFTNDGAEVATSLGDYPRILVMAGVALSFLFYRRLRGLARTVFWVAVAGTAALAAESLLGYGTAMVYPHVFQKVLVLFLLPGMYGLYQYWGRIRTADLVNLLWILLALNLTFINFKALSIGAFISHDRGLYASTVYLLEIPLLYHFNQYLAERQPRQLALFFLAGFAILFFQHRTVWVVSLCMLTLNVLVLLRVARRRLSFSALAPLVGIPLLVGGLGLTTLLVNYPELATKFLNDIADIQNHETQGTGSWRHEQTQAYLPFVKENLAVGMRFEGFELPIQFYDPEQKEAWFEDGHGHFFHSFYMDALFYFGLVGLAALMLPLLGMLGRLLRRPPAHPEALTWLLFGSSGLIFGYSYSFPLYVYGILGFGLYRLTQLDAAAQSASPSPTLPPTAAPGSPAPLSLPYPV